MLLCCFCDLPPPLWRSSRLGSCDCCHWLCRPVPPCCRPLFFRSFRSFIVSLLQSAPSRGHSQQERLLATAVSPLGRLAPRKRPAVVAPKATSKHDLLSRYAA